MKYLEVISLLPILSVMIPGVSASPIGNQVGENEYRGATGALFLDMAMSTCLKTEPGGSLEGCTDWRHLEGRYTVWNGDTSPSTATWTFTAFANHTIDGAHDLPDNNPLTTIHCDITTCPAQRTENSTIVISNFAPFVREIDPHGLTKLECAGAKEGDVVKDDTSSQHEHCSV